MAALLSKDAKDMAARSFLDLARMYDLDVKVGGGDVVEDRIVMVRDRELEDARS